MRILIGCAQPRDPNLGAAGTIFATVDALRSLGHDVHEIWEHDLGARRIRHGNLHYLLELPRRYRDAVDRAWRTGGFDVVQLSQPHAYLAACDHFKRGRKGVFVNRSHGWESHVFRVMQRLQANEQPDGRPRWRRLASSMMKHGLDRSERRVVQFSDGIVVGSEDDREYLISEFRLSPDRVLAVPPGMPDSFLVDNSPPLTSDRLKWLLYVGQFTPCKAPDVVAAVVNRLLSEFDGLQMTWVTQRAHHEAVRRWLDPQIAARVHLADWRSRDELIRIYDEHGLYLFPSYYEGFAKTFLEAMSRRMVVVGTAVDGMKQSIQTGINGFLSPAGDVEGLTEHCRTAIRNSSAMISIANRARETAAGFTWKNAAQTLVTFYERLLTMPRWRAVNGAA